jgi:hypothetical protein
MSSERANVKRDLKCGREGRDDRRNLSLEKRRKTLWDKGGTFAFYTVSAQCMRTSDVKGR